MQSESDSFRLLPSSLLSNFFLRSFATAKQRETRLSQPRQEAMPRRQQEASTVELDPKKSSLCTRICCCPCNCIAGCSPARWAGALCLLIVLGAMGTVQWVVTKQACNYEKHGSMDACPFKITGAFIPICVVTVCVFSTILWLCNEQHRDPFICRRCDGEALDEENPAY